MSRRLKSYRKYLLGTVVAAVVAPAVAPVTFAAEINFTDVQDGLWAAGEIYALADEGIINGYPDGTFKPNQSIIRGQAAMLLMAALDLDIPSSHYSFTDVPGDSTFAEAAAATTAAGIFMGSNGYFGAKDILTREQMASILVRAFGLENTGENITFTDFNDISSAHREDVIILAQNGITIGRENGSFDPDSPVTRAEFAVFMYRAMYGGKEPTPVTELEIESIISLNGTNRFLQINFSGSVSSLAPADIDIVDAKKGDRYGVKEVILAKDGRSAQIELYEGKADEEVLKANTEYMITVDVQGTLLEGNFYDEDFIEGRVVDINAGDEEFEIIDDDSGESLKIEVLDDDEFDYQAVLGELVRVWYNDDNELVKYEIVENSSVIDAIELTEVDEIRLISEDEEYDISDEEYDDDDEKKFKIYINGEDVTNDDGLIPEELADKGQKINFAKVGFDKSGDVEFISAYTLNNFLIVEDVDEDEVVGVEGEGTGGSFDAEDATLVKDEKVISIDDLDEGDLLFFNENADDGDGYAFVYNDVVAGEIDEVYSDAIEVDDEIYDFIMDDSALKDFSYSYDGDSADFEYGNAVYINDDDETEKIDSDIAEELQAGGKAKLYLDPAGNLVFVDGDTGDVDSNKQSALLIEDIKVDESYNSPQAQIEVVLENGEEEIYEMALEDLDTIHIDGEEYDIEENPDDDDEWEPTLSDNWDTIVLTNGENETEEIPLDQKGKIVTLHLDGDNVDEIEFFTEDGDDEGSGTINKTIESDDDYMGGKKLNSKTIVFDASDGYDAEDVDVTTWGDYDGSDIRNAEFVYDDDDEVVAFVIKETSSNDEDYETAVITEVLKNKDKEVVEIEAYVQGDKETFEVDEVDVDIEKGDVVVLGFDDNNTDLVKDIFKGTNLIEERGANDLTADDFVTSPLIVESVDVGNRTVEFTDGSSYKLISNGKVLDATDPDDITIEALSDLDEANIQVTVALDEENTGFANYFVFEEISEADYLALKAEQTPTAPVAKIGVVKEVEEGKTLTVSASDVATDVNGDTLSFKLLTADGTNAAATVTEGKLVITAGQVNANATDTITAVVTDGGKDATVTFTVNVTDVPTAAELEAAAITTINGGSATLANYTAAGITGVTAANLTDVNTAVVASKIAKGSDLTKTDIQDVVTPA